MTWSWEAVSEKDMKKKYTKKRKNIINFELLPAILLFAVLPAVVKGQAVKTELGKYPWFPDGEVQYDFFIYGKSVLFLILVIVMLFVLAGRRMIQQKKFRNWKIFFPLVLYAFLSVVSTVFSSDSTLSLEGMWQHHETIWVLLGYMITVFYCYQVTECTGDLQILLTALGAGALIQGVLGLCQFLGEDFFSTETGKAFLTAGLDSSLRENLVFQFEDQKNLSVYLASYNPNYAGVYLVLVIPVLTAFAFFLKKKAAKLFCAVLCGLLLLCLYGSGSRTGFLILCMLLILTAWLFPQKKKTRWIAAGCCLAAVLLAGAGYDVAKDHSLSRSLSNSVKKIQTYNLEGMEPGKDGVNFQYRGENLDLIPVHTENGDMIRVLTGGEEKYAAYWDAEEGYFKIQNALFRNICMDTYVKEGAQYLQIICYDIPWNFVKYNDADGFVYINRYGKADKIETAASVFDGYERSFSRRGYLWGRTIPLVGKHLLWGSGPDTFVLEFPQSDYVMRANAGTKMMDEIVTKPHSMYLQTAVQTGALSLACLFAFWLKYLSDFRRGWQKRSRNGLFALRLGFCLCIVGYLLMGFLNDSTLAAAPVFWGLLGVGTASLNIEE